MKILLLQARHPDDPAKPEEVESFARTCGVELAAITPHDLLQGPPDIERLDDWDVLMVGGSGDFYISQGDLPFQEETLAFLGQVVDRAFPTFASCFGYQCLVVALGGELLYDPQNTELGTLDIHLTPAGTEDELFQILPATFAGQLGHKDRALHPPPGIPNLAFSDRCAHQALRVPGKPIWATQFHPELDRETNYGRFQRYLDGYANAMSPDELARAHLHYRESPESAMLLPTFLEIVRGQLD